MDYKKMLETSNIGEFVNNLLNQFSFEIPPEIQNLSCPENMTIASQSLLKLSGYYSSLMTLATYSKLLTREYKRNKPKQDYEDMVDKKEAVMFLVDSVKQQYAAISRAVTIQIENNQELRMSGDKNWK